MTLQERVARYLDRNLQKYQADILVLMEEAAIALFSALPDHFLLFGGATLVLFHESPRISKDLDLLARVDRLPTAQELVGALEGRLQEVAGVLGLGPVAFEPETEGEHFVRLWTVGPAKQKLFTVDLTRIGGSVLLREIVKEDRGGREDRSHPCSVAGLPAVAKSGVVRAATGRKSKGRFRYPSSFVARCEAGFGVEGTS